MESLNSLLREAAVVTGALSLPIVLAATIVGGAIAVLQAATQIQEQTLTLFPKLLAIGLIVVLAGSLGMQLCVGLFHDAVRQIPAIISE